jgi:LysR family nitrogen assimilation transcriptional regulator
MELRQLEYFLAVADSSSFSRASAITGVAQPSLSRQVRQLEEELGVDLFYRHGRGVQLTEDGLTFRTRISPLLRELAQAASDLANAAAKPTGAILLGMPPSICALIAAPLVKSIYEQFPQVRLQVIEGFSGHINEWLMGNRLDMAVVNNARRSPYITMEPMLEMDLFYVSPREPGAPDPGDTVPFDEVAAHPIILPGRHHGLRREMDAAARRLGKPLNVIIEMDTLSALLEMVRDKVGPTVLPHGAITSVLNSVNTDPKLLVRRVVEPDLHMQFRIAYSLERPTTSVMRELARAIRAEVARAIDEGRMAGRLVGPTEED